jgi:hypothetical protein
MTSITWALEKFNVVKSFNQKNAGPNTKNLERAPRQCIS